MRVGDLIDTMQRLAPLELAEPWDRVGLQVGRSDADLREGVLLTIDLTERVLREAIERGVGAIIAYHPPLWTPPERLTDATSKERVLLGAAESKIAVYAPHTALDAAVGGVTDWLCAALGDTEFDPAKPKPGGDVRALRPAQRHTPSQEVKVVTFLPADKLDDVRNAMASAGAGIIGAYRVCSFSGEGEGTFFADAGANPAVGEAGRLERVPERRLEMVCAAEALPLVLETLRRFHPYEEPATDVYDLRAQPVRGAGVGRRLVLDQPVRLRDLADRLRRRLGHARIKLAPPDAADREITRIGVVPGAGEDMAPVAARQGCEVFVTGEMRHHSVLAALHDGLCVLLAGHTNTERGYLCHLSDRLARAMPGVAFHVSERDADPLTPL